MKKKSRPRRRAADRSFLGRLSSAQKTWGLVMFFIAVGALGYSWYENNVYSQKEGDQLREELAAHRKTFWEQIGKIRDRFERLETRR